MFLMAMACPLGKERGMTALRTTVAACVALLASYPGLNPAHASEGKADVVLRNGKIYTADSTRSIAQAIAFTGNTILAVGNNEDMVPPKSAFGTKRNIRWCTVRSASDPKRTLAQGRLEREWVFGLSQHDALMICPQTTMPSLGRASEPRSICGRPSIS